MKTINNLILAALLAGDILRAHAETNTPVPPPPAAAPAPPAATAAPPENASAIHATADTVTSPAAELAFPEVASNTDTNGLRLNFSNAPLDLVLKYLSDAAGFHIVVETPVRGNVTVISTHPMSKDEAVDLLNSVLNKNGAAAIRNGQFLTIVDRNEAKTRDIQVNVYNDDPKSIPKTAEIVTQIIPIRFVEAKQLVADLSVFVSPQATIVANEAGNSILVTDTQANIRHLAEIIKAIDSSAEASTEIKVYHLRYANPTDVATLLAGVFPQQGANGGTQSPIRFGGRGGGGLGGGFGGGPGGFFGRLAAAQAGGGGGSDANDRIRKQTQVTAVADLRTSSVVVTAQKDLIDQIDMMMQQLDVPSERDQQVTVFHVENGDPQQMVQVLQSTFGASGGTTSRGGASSTTSSALSQRAQQNAQQMGNSSSTTSTLGGGRGTGGNGARGVQF